MHIQMKHRVFKCHVCLAAFRTEEIMLKDIDEEHFILVSFVNKLSKDLLIRETT